MSNFKKSSWFIISCTIYLNACNNPANTVIIPASPKASASPVIVSLPTASTTTAPVIDKPVSIDQIKPVTNIPDIFREGPNTIGSKPLPITPAGSSNPVGQTGGTSDIQERATFNGKVYDPNGIVVDGATVTAKSVDANVSWVGEPQVTTNGAYVFRNAPVGARVEITVTKDGWTTRTRTEVLKSNLQGDPTANVFDFGGHGATGQDQLSSFYAIQDEPEISTIKINGITVSEPGTNGSPGLSGVSGNPPETEFTFSEPVDEKSFENSVRYVSQPADGSDPVTIDKSSSAFSFAWAGNDTSLKLKLNRPLLLNKNQSTTLYRIEFSNSFQDKTEKSAIKGKYIRFKPGITADYLNFTMKG